MESKALQPYKGYTIEKSYELHAITGKIKKDTIIYTAYTEDGGIFDGSRTLIELKRKIDEYIK